MSILQFTCYFISISILMYRLPVFNTYFEFLKRNLGFSTKLFYYILGTLTTKKKKITILKKSNFGFKPFYSFITYFDFF